MYYDKARTDSMGTLTVSGTTALTWAPGQVADVKRIVFVTTTALTVADSVITVAVRDVDDGNSTTIGTFTMVQSGSATDDVSYANIGNQGTGPTTASDGSTVYEGGDGVVEVLPGQELVLTSDGGSTAGAVEAYVEYIPGGFNEEADYVTAQMTFTAS